MRDIFSNNRGWKTTICNNIEGPVILKADIRLSLTTMNRMKTLETYGIIIEMMTLGYLGIDKIRENNEIYDKGETPEDLIRFILIAIPMKAGSN